MKKKLISLLLAICMMLPCVFALNACGEKEPTLTEANWNYVFNENFNLSSRRVNYTVTMNTNIGEDTKHFYFDDGSKTEFGGKMYKPYYHKGAYYQIQQYPADENGDIILNEKGEIWYRVEDFQEKYVVMEDLVKFPFSEQNSRGFNMAKMRTIEDDSERLAISDLENFSNVFNDKFSLFTIDKNVATLTENSQEFAALGEHVKTLYNLDGTIEWTEIKVEFKKGISSGVLIDENGNEIPYEGLGKMSFKANVVNSQTVNSIEIEFGDTPPYELDVEQMYCYKLWPTNFTITGVNNAQEEVYQFTENGLRAYRPDNPDESLREVIVYHDTTANTYTEYKKNTDGTWTVNSFTKEQYDLFVSTTKQLIFGNFTDAIAKNIDMLAFSKFESEYQANTEIGYISLNSDVILTSGAFSFSNVKFTGVVQNGNFKELKAVDYTLTYTVSNVVADVLNYHVEMGDATITLPTV